MIRSRLWRHLAFVSLCAFFLLNCKVTCFFFGVRGCPEPISIQTLALMTLLPAPQPPLVKIKNSTGGGFLEVDLQGTTLRADLDGETSASYVPISARNGTYRVTTGTDGILIDRTDFDYDGNFNDGVFITQDGSLSRNACFVLDRGLGQLRQEDCATFATP